MGDPRELSPPERNQKQRSEERQRTAHDESGPRSRQLERQRREQRAHDDGQGLPPGDPDVRSDQFDWCAHQGRDDHGNGGSHEGHDGQGTGDEREDHPQRRVRERRNGRQAEADRFDDEQREENPVGQGSVWDGTPDQGHDTGGDEQGERSGAGAGSPGAIEGEDEDRHPGSPFGAGRQTESIDRQSSVEPAGGRGHGSTDHRGSGHAARLGPVQTRGMSLAQHNVKGPHGIRTMPDDRPAQRPSSACGGSPISTSAGSGSATPTVRRRACRRNA